MEIGVVFLVPPCLYLCIIPMHHGQSGGYVKMWTSFPVTGCQSGNTVKTCVMLQRTLVWVLLGEWDGTQDGVCDVRCKLNLLAGSPVTVAYGLSDKALELRWNSSWRQMETVCPAQGIWSGNGERTRVS